ncbi:YbjQ family protein [Amylibacter sp.]|nr:YbjQ family protein [Amylibacter sp.]
MARCSACGTGMTFTESNIALSFGGKCKNCIVRDNPEQKDKLQNKKTKEQLILDAEQELDTTIDAIMLTTEAAPNINITKRIEIVTAECAFGMNIFKDLFAGVRDIVGGRSKAVQKTMRDSRRTALYELKKEAHAVGANAVVGVDLDYMELSSGGTMVLLVASGTAVVVEEMNDG